ncbi:DUF1045 domain-containing protein [Meridianimarinicoccus aquatilis]|uniref:DUF1045 domain-containing protein n=1 Tax=Meridianimarinicoccus aquatilis TaxID=2552766 RepID=A0A4V3BB04_9RHOB|nr:DUF1045 domain-containing protein [Fluviibacterium aquatile]TDL85159.1 DUF1045 domain-containing protein [Fluviibacterium aquatile]
MSFTRYAIYFTPAPGQLADFGAEWLGWDSAAGSTRAHPVIPGLSASVAALTARPRKYGFHGTLKAPFRLAADRTETALLHAVDRLASTLAPVTLQGLKLDQIGGFLALTPAGSAGGLTAFAADVVEQLDSFRAPPTADEIARRNPARLTPRQQTLLANWGYPYVQDQFRFHMTLTGPVPREHIGAVRSALAPVLAPILPQPFRIDALTLLGADTAGRFHQITRVSVSG